MSILGNLFGKRTSASRESVTFDATRYSDQGSKDGAHIWYLPEGGGIGLYYFGIPPDLPGNLEDLEQLRDHHTGVMGPGMKLVECSIMTFDGVRGVWLIGKSMEGDGPSKAAVYLGSITIPFRDFSFVLKVECQEKGITGTREALLINEALRDGTGSIQGDKFVSNGWSFDDEQFDHRFPRHPLSRLRRELKHVAASLRIEERIKRAPGFPLPHTHP